MIETELPKFEMVYIDIEQHTKLVTHYYFFKILMAIAIIDKRESQREIRTFGEKEI